MSIETIPKVEIILSNFSPYLYDLPKESIKHPRKDRQYYCFYAEKLIGNVVFEKGGRFGKRLAAYVSFFDKPKYFHTFDECVTWLLKDLNS